MEPIGVVVVHRNRPDACSATVDRFMAQTVPVAVTVVDCGSDPADRQRLEEFLADRNDVDLVSAVENLGFGPGANRGLRSWLTSGTGSWVAVAPHDAEPAPDALERMYVEVDRRPRAGLACGDFGDDHSPVLDRYFGGMLRPGSRHEGWEPVDYPHGTLLMGRRAMWEDIGLFDERYFSYCEEADLGARARNAGWEVGLVRGARVDNRDVSGTEAVVDYLQVRNTLLLVRDHFGRYAVTIRFLIALGQLGIGALMPSRRPPMFTTRARVRALLDHLAKRYGPPPATIMATRAA